MSEEKYIQDMVKMTLAEQQGAASASKKHADKRFQRFDADIPEVIERLQKCERCEERHRGKHRQV